MANRIKGITIEIGGDTTKLNTALKKTDSQLKTTRTSLADVNRLLRLDPKNTVLLEQMQKNLASAISGTKTRLSELKRAEEQMRGKDLTEEQRREYEALQREIVSTEADLKRLEKQMRDFGSVGAQKIREAGKSVEEFGGKLQKAGGAISAAGQKLLPVTAAITGIAAASVKAWRDVDKGADTIVTLTGATGDALEEMRGIMNEISTEIPTDFDIAGNAIGEVNSRFNLQGEELKRLSRQYIEFADINKSDVVSSIDTTQKAMAAWNVETEDAAKYLDALTAASQKSGVKVETIAAQATTNAAALKELGFSASGAAMFLGQLEKNGVDASGAMAGLKKAYANALKDGTSLNRQLQDLEERLRNEKTRAAAAAEAIELFGARSGGALAEAISSGRLSFEQLETSLDDFAGTVSTTFEATLDPLDNTKKVLNELKLTGAQLVESAAPLINDVLAEATKGAKELSKWLGTLSEKERQTLVKTAAIAAAAGPLLITGGKIVSTTGKLVSGAGSVIKFLPKIASGAKAAGGALAGVGATAGPILGVVAAVAALGVGIYALDKLQKKQIKETYGLSDAEKDLVARIKEETAAYKEAEAARSAANKSIDAEYAQNKKLWGELQNIVDANGKIKSGYEDRANVITTLLADSLGVEIKIVDGQIQQYGELKNTINDVIATKRAEALLDANKDAYTNAIQNSAAAYAEYTAAVAAASAKEKELHDARENLAYLDKMIATSTDPQSQQMYVQIRNNELRAIEELEKSYNELSTEVDNSESKYLGFANTIENYEGLIAAAAEDDADALAEAMNRLSNGFMTAENATEAMLRNQLSNFQKQYSDMKAAVAAGMPGVTQEQVDQMAELIRASEAELQKLAQKNKQGVENAANALIPYNERFRSSWQKMIRTTDEMLENLRSTTEKDLGDEGEYTGSSYGLGLLRGLRAKEAEIRIVAGNIANSIPKITQQRLQVKSPSRIATWITENWDQGLIDGLLEKAAAVAKTAQGVASGIVVSPPPASFTRYSETAADAQSAPFAAVSAPNSAAVNHVLGMILDRLYNLDVGIRNAGEFADGVTNYANRRLGRISALQESGVI